MDQQQIVAHFDIPYRAYLDGEGMPLAALPAWIGDSELLRRMYRMMVRARAFDTKAVNLQRTGKLGTYPSCLGHEATHVGVGAAMRPEDVLFTVYREIGTKFWRGVELLDVLLYWGGDERGTIYQRTPQDFPFCVPIGSQMPHAAGAALAMQIRDERRCAVAFIGDGGTSQGAFYEAINFAGVKSLPLVCVIVNNRWAISVPVTAQTAAETLAQKAIAAGIPAVQVDGNDVLVVREVVGEALERARARRRADGHRSAHLPPERSHHLGRCHALPQCRGGEAARRLEPIARMRNFLQSRRLWDDADEQRLQERVRRGSRRRR